MFFTLVKKLFGMHFTLIKKLFGLFSISRAPKQSSLDQKIPKDQTAGFRHRHLITNLALLLISGLLLAATVIILLPYNNTPLNTWNHPALPLTAAISLLAAASKLALLLPVTEAIGQAKWALFSSSRQTRKLSDLDLADSASRDPVGALTWILRFRSGAWVHLGAAVVLVSLAWEPASQLMLRVEEARLGEAGGRLAMLMLYSPIRGLDTGLSFTTPMAVQWGAESFVYGLPVQAAVECESGDCTFPETKSVGMCTACTDVTAGIVHSCVDLTAKAPLCIDITNTTCYTTGSLCTYRHPALNGSVGGGSGFMQISAKGANFKPSSDPTKITLTKDVVTLTALYIQPNVGQDLPDTGERLETRIPLAPGHVKAKDGIHSARAYTCTISYCEQHITSVVRGGVLNETITIPPQNKEYTMDVITGFTDEVLQLPMNLTSGANSTAVSFTALYALSYGFSRMMEGSARAPSFGESYDEWILAIYGKLVNNTITELFDGLAHSISAALRNDSGVTAAGTLWRWQVVWRVQWVWIALPAGVWVLALVLLLGVAGWAKKKHAPWLGSSQLAGVFIDLEREVRVEVEEREAPWMDREGMRRVGEGVKVRVAPVHGLEDGKAKMEFTRICVGMKL